MKNHKLPGLGTITVVVRRSVKMPKDTENKRKVFNYIQNRKGLDVLEDYLTIHSTRLNTFWKEEFEIAKQDGNVDWILDGIGEPEKYETISMKKG